MKNGDSGLSKPGQTRFYYPRHVPMAAIRRFARQIVERFHPDKIILFGSYAYGTPTPDSDVDLLVVMPARNQIEQAVRIDEAIDERGFALDLLVRTPKVIENRLRWGDWFIKEIMERGKVLYEKDHARVGPQSRKRDSRRSPTPQAPAAHQR
jgi:predicted nucleotidyltransferase